MSDRKVSGKMPGSQCRGLLGSEKGIGMDITWLLCNTQYIQRNVNCKVNARQNMLKGAGKESVPTHNVELILNEVP